MAWTYTNSPETSNRDAVRLLIGDVDSTDPQLTDAEITYYVNTYGSVANAAAKAARGLAALYARKVDKAVGDLRLSLSARLQNYLDLATRLEDQLSRSGVGLYAGGISRADKDAVEEDSDRVRPSFRREGFDNPKATYPDDSQSNDPDWES